MIPNNNLNILAFYDSTDKWNHNKYQVDDIFNLISENFRALPFQIVRDHLAATPITVCNLHDFETSSVTNILPQMVAAGLTVTEFASDNYDLLINPSALGFVGFSFPAGRHYIEIGDGTNTWFSEVFNVVDHIAPYLQLEYWHNNAITYTGGRIDYTAPYRNRCFLPIRGIGKPQYPFEEVVRERQGYKFPIEQVSYKLFNFEFFAPEYLTDAIRIVRLHDNVTITYEGDTYETNDIIITPRWQDQGDIAAVTVEFRIDSVIVSTARGIAGGGGNAFNNDFSNDFG